MRVRWGALLVGALVVAGSVACTGGGDDEVRTDEDGTTAAFRDAVEHTFESSGRYTYIYDNDDEQDVHESGEFAGRNVRSSTASEDRQPVEGLVVDDTVYVQIAPLLAAGDATDQDRALVAGKTWLRVTPTEEERTRAGGDGAMLDVLSMGFGTGTGVAESLPVLSHLGELLRSADDVRADGSVQVDGRSFDRYRGRFGGRAFERAIGRLQDDDPMASSLLLSGDGDDPRVQAVQRYEQDHTHVDVTVLAAGSTVRRVELRVTTDIEKRYRDCTFLDASTGTSRIQVDVTDAGTPIRISAPAAAETASAFDLMQQEMQLDEDMGDDTEEPPGPGELHASDGNWTRDEIEETVIDEADRLGVDPVRVPALPDTELLALYERSLTLDGPMLATSSDGDMPRDEVVSSVIAGADGLGIDPATVPSMTDADLISAYDRVMEKRYGEDDLAVDDTGIPDEMLKGCPA